MLERDMPKFKEGEMESFIEEYKEFISKRQAEYKKKYEEKQAVEESQAATSSSHKPSQSGSSGKTKSDELYQDDFTVVKQGTIEETEN